jgi:heavy metal translocating P-type ATPase
VDLRKQRGPTSGASARTSWGPGIFFFLSLGGLAAGGSLHLLGVAVAGDVIWRATIACGLALSLWWSVQAVRQGRLGVDVLASLALAGTLVVGELLAGGVVTVMLASGRALEASANRRARRSLSALVERAPQVVHRRAGSGLHDIGLAEVAVGDLLAVLPGEVLPTDGVVAQGPAIVDESALTGEALPVERSTGVAVRSGTLNAGGPFELRATTTAEQSTYAAIVRLVDQADAESAPLVRSADRYALWFLLASLGIGGAAWAISGELSRAVAVLVVATPCPLILAAPVAVVAGLSQAARRGVIVKGGRVLEALGRAKVLLLDKTGTITVGSPTVAEIVPLGDWNGEEVLRLAASLDQVSPHVLAASLVTAARSRGLGLSLPGGTEEVLGQGLRGRVEGHTVAVGKASWVTEGTTSWARTIRQRADRKGRMAVFVGVDGHPAGAVLLEDPIRPDAARMLRRLRAAGVDRVVMVTGDRAETAAAIGAALDLDEVLAERTPAEKVDAVRLARRLGPTIMVGDGINDAPALALADVGVAIGSRATAAAEAADVVLSADRLDHLGEAMDIARRSGRIARQSMVVGIALSLGAMVPAALGLLPATFGALAQEAIDVVAILNALRAMRPPPGQVALNARANELARGFRDQHTALRPGIDWLRGAADGLGSLPIGEAMALVRASYGFLVGELAPHEQAEDRELYPALDRSLGGVDPTATMSRSHVEIAHLTGTVGRLLAEIADGEASEDEVRELRRTLYGLEAVLRLHFAQEDEAYFSLIEEERRPNPANGGHVPERPGAGRNPSTLPQGFADKSE